jgi:hypothetical protein
MGTDILTTPLVDAALRAQLNVTNFVNGTPDGEALFTEGDTPISETRVSTRRGSSEIPNRESLTDDNFGDEDFLRETSDGDGDYDESSSPTHQHLSLYQAEFNDVVSPLREWPRSKPGEPKRDSVGSVISTTEEYLDPDAALDYRRTKREEKAAKAKNGGTTNFKKGESRIGKDVKAAEATATHIISGTQSFVRSLQETQRNLTMQVQDLQALIGSLTKQLGILNSELQHKREDLLDTQKKVLAMNKALQTYQTAKARVTQELEQLRLQNEALLVNLTATDKTELDKVIASMKIAHDQEVQRFRSEIRDLSASVSRLELENTQMKADLADSQMLQDVKDQELRKSKAAVADLTRQQLTTKANHDMLIAIVKRYESELRAINPDFKAEELVVSLVDTGAGDNATKRVAFMEENASQVVQGKGAVGGSLDDLAPAPGMKKKPRNVKTSGVNAKQEAALSSINLDD